MRGSCKGETKLANLKGEEKRQKNKRMGECHFGTVKDDGAK